MLAKYMRFSLYFDLSLPLSPSSSIIFCWWYIECKLFFYCNQQVKNSVYDFLSPTSASIYKYWLLDLNQTLLFSLSLLEFTYDRKFVLFCLFAVLLLFSFLLICFCWSKCKFKSMYVFFECCLWKKSSQIINRLKCGNFELNFKFWLKF